MHFCAKFSLSYKMYPVNKGRGESPASRNPQPCVYSPQLYDTPPQSFVQARDTNHFVPRNRGILI